MNDRVNVSFFSIRKIILCCLLSSAILFSADDASAFFSDGKIDDNFSYRSLRLEMVKTKKKGCYLEGEISNNTGIAQEDIAITFYAFDYFDHFLWKQKVDIDFLDPSSKGGKSREFRKKMRQCDMPDKFQFKVSGVKGKDPKQVFPNKPKSEKAVTGDHRKKENSSAGAGHSHSANQTQFSRQPENAIQKNAAADISPSATLVRNYMIILKNGKEIFTDSYREQDQMLYFNQGGGEVQIHKDKVSEIKKLN